jgi:hypothetical protein
MVSLLVFSLVALQKTYMPLELNPNGMILPRMEFDSQLSITRNFGHKIYSENIYMPIIKVKKYSQICFIIWSKPSN